MWPLQIISPGRTCCPGKLEVTRLPGEKASDGKIGSTDRLIDNLVYELYGPTEDEIRTVEG
jgi:type II restriction/modification system DNA methylase subunit YeeA